MIIFCFSKTHFYIDPRHPPALSGPGNDVSGLPGPAADDAVPSLGAPRAAATFLSSRSRPARRSAAEGFGFCPHADSVQGLTVCVTMIGHPPSRELRTRRFRTLRVPGDAGGSM